MALPPNVEVALNESNKLWEYYHRQTELWNQYAGNFYKATTIFSALIGGILTWSASRDVQALVSFSALLLFASMALLVLFIVGWQTLIMIAREIANSQIYLSAIGALRSYIFQNAGLEGITPLHIARDSTAEPPAPPARIPPDNPKGIRNNEQVTVICTISAAILTAAIGAGISSIYELRDGTPFSALVDRFPTSLQLLVFGGAALVGFLAIFLICRGKAESEYVNYLRRKNRVPRGEWRDDLYGRSRPHLGQG